MKSERRHELETNTLALWLRFRAPELLQKHGSKILLGVVIVILAVVLIRNRLDAPRRAAEAASQDLSLARTFIETLRQQPETWRESTVAEDAIRRALEKSDAPALQAQAYVVLGDYYWLLANHPTTPQTATQPSLTPDIKPDAALSKAQEAYEQVLKQSAASPYDQAAAHMGLAAIAENRSQWDTAHTHYEAINNLNGIPLEIKELAGDADARLAKLKQPVWIVAATNPATFPTTFPTTLLTTIPTTLTTRPTTLPTTTTRAAR